MKRNTSIRIPTSWKLRVLFTISLLWLAPTLACGSFAPRPTATPTLPPMVEQPPTAAGEPEVIEATPAPEIVLDTPAPSVTATFTPTPIPGTVLAVGQQARVTAPFGINIRDAPSTSGRQQGLLGTGQLVNIVEGPVTADDYTWWKIDDRQGNAGWGAEGDGETVWLSPNVGGIQPVNRPPAVGDRVKVTMGGGGQLSVRSLPGRDAPLVSRVNDGSEYTVLAGPQVADGYTWYQLRSDDASVQGWAADGDGEDRWLSPLE